MFGIVIMGVVVTKEKEYDIMYKDNGHDNELVRKINDAWRKNAKGFEPILKALFKRDIDEITDHDSFQIEAWRDSDEYNIGIETGDWTDYNNMALEYLCKYWMGFADNYLQHIADDCDLECILNFLHYPYLPIYK